MAKPCPLCQQPLVELERLGVRLDVCSRCQGVWLDQGELEQFVGHVRAALEAASPGSMNGPTQDRHGFYEYEHDRDYDYDRDDERYEYDHRRHRTRRFEIADPIEIFG